MTEHEHLHQPDAEYQRLLYAWAQAQFTEEELDEAEQQSEEYTTAEVLSRFI